MKTFLSILLSIVFHFTTISQDSILDTIYFNDGKVEAVDITGFEESIIKFTYPGEGIPISMSKSKVMKVITRNGRVENFETTPKIKSVYSCEGWDNVEVTAVDSEVEGLIRVHNVSGKAEGTTTFSSLDKIQNRAMTKMRMQASFLGCDVVYMLNQTNKGATYGNSTVNSIVNGTAYTTYTVAPNENTYGQYLLKKAYRLKPNDYELKSYNITNLNARLTVNKGDLILEEDFYEISYDSGINNSKNKMFLLNSSDDTIVFLVIDRNNASKIKYYNLFFKKI